MSTLRKAFTGSLWMTGLNYARFGLLFVGNVVLARILTPSDFGVMALALSMNEIIFMLAGFGFSMACIHYQELEDAFETGLLLASAAGFVVCLVGLASAWGLNRDCAPPLPEFLAVLSIVAGLRVPATVYLARIDKDLSFGLSALVQFLSAVLGMGVALWMAYAGFGAWSLLGREVVGAVLFAIGSALFSPLRFSLKFNPDTARKIGKFCFGMLGMRISDVMYAKGVNLAFGFLAGTNVFGLYSRSQYLASLPNSAMAPFHVRVVFTLLSRIKKDQARFGDAAGIVLWILSRVSLLTGLIILVFPEETITLVLGEQWRPAAEIFRGTALLAAFLPLYSSLRVSLLSQNHARAATYARVIALILSLAGIAVVWGLDMDWAWASWAVSTSNFVSLVYLGVFTRRIEVNLNWCSILVPPCLMAAVLGGILFFVYGRVHYIPLVILTILTWFGGSAMVDIKEYKRLYSLVRR